MQVNIKLAVLLLLFSLVHTNVTTKTVNYETMVIKKAHYMCSIFINISPGRCLVILRYYWRWQVQQWYKSPQLIYSTQSMSIENYAFIYK